MRHSAPKVITWVIALILGVGGILMHMGTISIPVLDPYEFWIEAAAWGILALGSILPGM